MSDETKNKSLPSPRDFFTRTPLYSPFTVNNLADVWRLRWLLEFSGEYDAYCPRCRKDSTFEGLETTEPAVRKAMFVELATEEKAVITVPPRLKSEVHRVSLRCKRKECRQRVYIRVQAVNTHTEQGALLHGVKYYTVHKIGQDPSIADIELPDVDKYRAVLTDEQQNEFYKAITSAANGYAIGAYVYLRRIFEGLVTTAHREALEDGSVDEAASNKATRMHEKIGLLKHHLPDSLVENAGTYTILSLGIHELSEARCGKYYDLMYASIKLILDEQLERAANDARREQIRKAIHTAQSELGAERADK